MRRLLLPIVLGYALGRAVSGLWSSDPLAERTDALSTLIANFHEPGAALALAKHDSVMPRSDENASSEQPRSVRLNRNVIESETTSI